MKLLLIAAGAIASAFVGITAGAAGVVQEAVAAHGSKPQQGLWKTQKAESEQRGNGFEGEVAVGAGSLRGHNGRSLSEWVPQIVLEGRMVDHVSGWDAAMQLEFGAAQNRHDGYRTTQFLMSFFGDYNIRPVNAPLQFFVGAGLGFGYVDDPELSPLWRDENGDTTANVVLFSPRIGLEYRNRLRLTIDRKWMGSYSATFFSVGYVFGRGRR